MLAAEHWARAAQRALAANALADAMSMAERALMFAENKPKGFLRASYLDEAWSRLDPRASDRESAILSMEDNVYDEASAVRARGARARYDDARGSGEGISERLAETRDQAAALGLLDEEARCSAVLALRVAFAGRFAEAEAEIKRLLKLARQQSTSAAAVDAYQTQAIVRQTQGSLASALEARRNAASAARGAGLKEREAIIMTNLGFALTTIGARQEARTALETGLALSDAIGSLGAVRHAQMNLLGWAATFGNDRLLEAHLAEVRADADAAATGAWAAPDRANLGMLFYRGSELLRASAEREWRRALGLLRIAAQSYRTHRPPRSVAGRARPVGGGRAALRQRWRRGRAGARGREFARSGRPQPAQRVSGVPRVARRLLGDRRRRSGAPSHRARHAVARPAAPRLGRHSLRAPVPDRVAGQRPPARRFRRLRLGPGRDSPRPGIRVLAPAERWALAIQQRTSWRAGFRPGTPKAATATA